MIVKKIVTGLKSFNYIRSQLNIGIYLSNCISKLPIENGDVFSFVPEETSEENLFNFGSGGIYPFDKDQLKTTNLIPIRNDSKSIVLNEILEFIKTDESNCCLFADPSASPNFPWVKSSGIEYVFLKHEEMYYYFDNRKYDLKEINEAFTISDTYIFLCALSSLNLEQRSYFEPFKEITTNSLDIFVKNTSAFFMKAYDHEGYLLWTKTSHE